MKRSGTYPLHERKQTRRQPMPHPEDKATPFHAMNTAQRKAAHKARASAKKHRPLGSGDKPKGPKGPKP